MDFKIFSLRALTLALVLGTVSCSSDSERLFDTDPSQRLQQGITEARQVLTSAKNGWRMQIFPGETQPYGGYTLFLKFSPDGSVEATSERTPQFRLYTSSYRIDPSSGVTLTFDTKNEAIHLFSEPESIYWLAQGASTNKGADGDFSFQIVRASSSEVILRGLRSGARAVLTPLSETSWEEQLTALKESYARHTLPFCTINIAGKSVPARMNYTRRHLIFTYEGASYALPYVYTERGIRLYEPVTIAGVELNSFELNGDKLSAADGRATISARTVSLAEHVLSDVWYVKPESEYYSGRGATGITRGHAVTNRPPLAVRLGRFATQGESGFGVWMMLDFRPIFGLIPLRLPLDVTTLAPDKLRFELKLDQIRPDTNQEFIINELAPGLKALAAPFANVGKVDIGLVPVFNEDFSPRTLLLSSDNLQNPSWIKFEDESDSNNWIKLVRYP